ncbi:MAG: YbjN domain-containing protein [Pseudomonadota bacterium]
MMAIQFAPVPARAAEPVPADPWEVIHTARKMGAAEVRRDTLRDPVIAANSDGLRYQIAFYGCHLGRRCETLLFQARLRDPRWKNDPPRPADMDVWNATKVYGRAFLAASGHAVLEHPVAMHGGIPQATLAATFEAWLDALEEFSDHVDFNTKSGP